MRSVISPSLRTAALALLVGATVGCSSLRPAAVAPTEQPPHLLKFWQLQGRIGVKTAEEGWSANLFWEHEGRQDRLRLSGPFSQGMLSIIVQDDLIHVNEGNGVEHSSRDVDGLLRERLGFSVPLQSLRYWVTGVPAPEAEFVAASAVSGGGRGFTQQGWVLAYEQFSRVGAWLLPQKATIRGNGVRLKLVVDDWVIKE